MRNAKQFIVTLLVASSFGSFAQIPERTANPKLIAVVNRANWCGVCKANAERFTAVLIPYSANGVNIYINDLTNEKTKAISNQELEKDNVYEAVYTIRRKGMGKALKSCGVIKDKKQTTDVAGIVTFIDPATHKQIKQLSIAASDVEMKKTINKLLNSAL